MDALTSTSAHSRHPQGGQQRATALRPAEANMDEQAGTEGIGLPGGGAPAESFTAPGDAFTASSPPGPHGLDSSRGPASRAADPDGGGDSAGGGWSWFSSMRSRSQPPSEPVQADAPQGHPDRWSAPMDGHDSGTSGAAPVNEGRHSGYGTPPAPGLPRPAPSGTADPQHGRPDPRGGPPPVVDRRPWADSGTTGSTGMAPPRSGPRPPRTEQSAHPAESSSAAPPLFAAAGRHRDPRARPPAPHGPGADASRPAPPSAPGFPSLRFHLSDPEAGPTPTWIREDDPAEATADHLAVPPAQTVPPAASPVREPIAEETPEANDPAGPVGGPNMVKPTEPETATLGLEPTAPGREPAPPGASDDSPAQVAEPAPADAQLIRRTMEAIAPHGDKVISYFYAVLFLGNPELRELFPAAMDHQRDRLLQALLTAAKHADDPDTLTEYLSRLGRGHRKYGTRPEHYPAVGEALISALTRYAADVWNEETERAWVRAYTLISQIMIDAASADEQHSPPWWHAEIVSHETRTHDVAVVTVRPDQPYPFRAGQYTMLETPWWPRVWRHYSFAAAPRSDGLLSFHIKSVPAGWVSSALVNRARPGDVIRLGPPAGSMVVDHDSRSGMLCLGGGTGIAPIKAIVEDVVEHGERRPVEVFYGARSDHDLYDLDTMLGLAQKHPWLSVRSVVAEGPTRGLTGPLPDIVRQYGPWDAFDAYLSGPPGMIRSGVDTLVGIGIPSHRIRHDFAGELVAADSSTS